VPWKCLSQDIDHKYIHSDSLPDGQLLLDPSKLRVVMISSIWDHWARRQKEGSQALVFLQAQEGDMREKLAKERGGGRDKPYDEIDHGEGGSGGANKPHPDSPAAHCHSADAKLSFLKGLTMDGTYQRFRSLLLSVVYVSHCFLLQMLFIL
jgi:hypothetical protein